MRMTKKTILAFALGACVGVGVTKGIAWFIWARTASASNACINNLRQFDGAVQQWALEHHKTANDVPSWDDIRPYVKLTSGELPPCSRGGTYVLGRADEIPRCTVMEHNFGFGSVTVLDQSGLPLADASITVRDRGTDILSATTSTNGEAYLLNDRNLWESVCWSNAWSKSTIEILAAKDGYSSNRVALPTIYWPVKLVLEKAKK